MVVLVRVYGLASKACLRLSVCTAPEVENQLRHMKTWFCLSFFVLFCLIIFWALLKGLQRGLVVICSKLLKQILENTYRFVCQSHQKDVFVSVLLVYLPKNLQKQLSFALYRCLESSPSSFKS